MGQKIMTIDIFLNKGFRYWLPYYLWQQLFKKRSRQTEKPLHILFCFVDHFEPFSGGAELKTAKWRVEQWVKYYPKMANKHKDADGKPSQHTWFYPPHLDHRFLEDLVSLCNDGYGEIEMHLHHNHMEPFPDTSETLRGKIQKCIDDYSKYGIFCLPDGSRRFAFIHGDWSLDNSVGPEICGVNDEISILKECGCYADFTFPSLGRAQPAMVNTFYYAKDNPKCPKSYTWGKPVRAWGRPWGDLMMIQGIIGFRWRARTHKYRPSIEASNISKSDYPFPKRIDYWVRNAIAVKGRPDWLFIKLHTHGCCEMDLDCLLGKSTDNMYSYLEEKYNDKKDCFLHYVTAREMYNIVKAAEAGMDGDPKNFRDFEVPRYVYL